MYNNYDRFFTIITGGIPGRNYSYLIGFKMRKQNQDRRKSY